MARPIVRRLQPVVLAVLLASFTIGGCRPVTQDADLAFRNGRIFTADPNLGAAEAVAVRQGRIVYVGSDGGLTPYLGPATEVIDLAGRMLLPGFHDTHVHPVSGGIELGECDLNAAATRAEVVSAVADCAARAPDQEWVRGGGFQLTLFPNGAPPGALLDSIVPDRPAYLTSADGHSAWVNSHALQRAGITATTRPPPPDGVIVHTDAGEPQGTLRESAMDLVERQIPPRSDADILAGLQRGLALAASYGITTLHEANASEEFVRAYVAAEEAGTLTARAILSLAVDPERGVDQVADLAAIRDRSSTDLVRPVAAKIFVDGVIEGGTGALLEPYLGAGISRGTLNYSPDTLSALVQALDDAGFKVHMHAIGDRAIRVAFDAFESQHARDGGAGPRHIMAHIQLFDPADIPRFATLGVVASFQPLWFYADTYITELTEPRLGPDRSRYLYPARSVLESGALVAAGSDWSVSSMNPLLAIETAITRRNPDLDQGPAWIPEERLDLESMLMAYSLNGAVAGDVDQETGSLTVGKSADLVVLSRDLFEIPVEGISDVLVDLTLLEGRVVYRR